MANYDQFMAAVSELSGGKNVVLLDDLGLPSVYVAVNQLKNNELFAGGTETIHPAFRVNGKDIPAFYYSKYQNVVINDRAYSLAHRDPTVNITFDKAKAACDAKGKGFHLGTLQEWAAIALWCKKNGSMPTGNNNYGRDVTNTWEKGEGASFEGSESPKKIDRTFTGSGPATWYHDGTYAGIADMNGNVWEWLGGMRLKDGEIQVIKDNDAANGSGCDMGAESTAWQAINASTGVLQASAATGTLHYDSSTAGDATKTNHDHNGDIKLSDKVTNKIYTGEDVETYYGYDTTEFGKIAAEESVTALEIAKALMLFPAEASESYTTGDLWWLRNYGERLPIAGGDWDHGADAGVFALDLDLLRSSSNGSIGFRSAFVYL